MKLKLLCFGSLSDEKGIPLEMDAAEGCTVQQLLVVLGERISAVRKLRETLAVAVNHSYAKGDQPLKDGDEVALLPPVSGGKSREDFHVFLTHAPIDAAGLLAAIAAPENGAVCAFTGVVRNHSQGRETQFLEYQAYEAMALERMRALARQAAGDFGVDRIAMAHRLGRLCVGEASVFIAVGAAHRDAAFAACRWLIDTLKATVPIWKKEYFTQGAAWAAGEPLNAEALR